MSKEKMCNQLEKMYEERVRNALSNSYSNYIIDELNLILNKRLGSITITCDEFSVGFYYKFNGKVKVTLMTKNFFGSEVFSRDEWKMIHHRLEHCKRCVLELDNISKIKHECYLDKSR